MPKQHKEEIRYNPIRRAEFEKSEIVAIHALMQGTATSEQQKLAVETILGPKICDTWGMSYRDNDRLTCVALGAQNVGQTLVFIHNVAIHQLNTDKLALRAQENDSDGNSEKA